MSRFFFAALALSLLACGFNPVSGDYRLSEDGAMRGDCDLDFEEDTGEDEDVIAIEVDPEDEQMVWDADAAPEEGWDNECDLDGKAFTCALYDQVTDDGQGTGIRVTLDVEGEWTGRDAFEGTMFGAIDCEGDNCAQYAQYGITDCTYEQDFVGELLED